MKGHWNPRFPPEAQRKTEVNEEDDKEDAKEDAISHTSKEVAEAGPAETVSDSTSAEVNLEKEDPREEPASYSSLRDTGVLVVRLERFTRDH